MSADEETAKREQLESQEVGDSSKTDETQNTPDTEDKPAEEQSTEEQQRPASRDGSDQDTETFEDAVDTGSLRSLTKHQQPVKRAPVEDRTDSDYEDEASQSASANGRPDSQEVLAEKKIPRPLSQESAGSLDNVNLDDDAAATTAPAQQEKSPPPEKASKTMSFSSLTNALPPMPWSPPATDSRSRSPPATAAAPPPPAPAPAPAPAPSGRKFNSPFSWLSRSSSKEPPAVQPTPSTRRNTASSVATLTSNPEMMLSKLEEEKDGEDGPRNSLKDRFKALRMREEATAPTEDDKTLAVAGDAGDSGVAAQPPPSPLPQSPNKNLAPGTASGVTAGPSSIVDVPVDWDLWQSVVNEGPAAVARTSPEELNKAIATGIPSAIRGVIWQVLAQSKNEELEAVYRELVVRGTDKEKKVGDRRSSGTATSAITNGSAKGSGSSASSVHSENSGSNGAPSPTAKDSDSVNKAHVVSAAERQKKEKEDLAMLHKLEKTIRRDLGARTSYSKFAAAQGLQEGLFGVCKAYALFDEAVGYAQGMNFLVMPLLFNMPEEEAFCLLVRLMNQYHLRDLFVQDMPGLHLHLYQFERLLEELEPALYCHLRRRGISPHLYATQWFLTLFAYRFPLQLVLRIYDLILSEGLSAILKFGTVLMQKNAAALLAISDMAQLTGFLKDRVFDVYIDASPSSNSILENGFFGSSSSSMDKEVYRADQLVRDACEVKITPEMLKSYQVEWEEKTRAEREREAELEALRASNASYAIRMRKLEERLQDVDAEQASLATELVHTKVDNNDLRDENEGLKIQVQELRIVIEKQPAELETAWQLERDDLMKRNGKVHEENQRLEKELSELEEELVQTKMQYAEINSQHEALTRKWTDLKRQFQ
ncbi:rab-GTPase-TBC domain-containing protein [Parachaetomium inaequale]|uniref:GTPase-activating protein GYP5 n=1 Tax=Parachaetomium inaequale TaxID=2588326 RepID=A0AAN6SN56_9PEZI|nr:rab-GTPase-TBC domain-containing protein [Parachaetomium inaequale]